MYPAMHPSRSCDLVLRIKEDINNPTEICILLAPVAARGNAGAQLALATMALVMQAVKKPLPAIAAGSAVAAVVRQEGV